MSKHADRSRVRHVTFALKSAVSVSTVTSESILPALHNNNNNTGVPVVMFPLQLEHILLVQAGNAVED